MPDAKDDLHVIDRTNSIDFVFVAGLEGRVRDVALCGADPRSSLQGRGIRE